MRPSLSIAILIAVGVVVAVAVSSPRDLNVPTEATPSNSPLAGGGSETEEDVSTPLTEINPSGSPEAPITLNDLIPVGPPSQWVIEGVPYIAETPDGVWTGPWKNACEEASIAMVEFFYSGKVTVTKDEAKTYMSNLFEIEDRLWGQNANSDAAQTTGLPPAQFPDWQLSVCVQLLPSEHEVPSVTGLLSQPAVTPQLSVVQSFPSPQIASFGVWVT